MEIPNTYRFTERDAEEAHKLQVAYFVDHAPWSEQMEFAWLCLEADDLHRQTGKWPTLGEVLTEREKKAERQQR